MRYQHPLTTTMNGSLLFFFFLIAAVVCTNVLTKPTFAQNIEKLQQEGTKKLVIQYQTDVIKRAEFRKFLVEKQMKSLSKLKTDGKILNYRILFSWYAQPEVWDAMLELTFESPTDLAHWKKLEETMPGGLSPEGLALGHPVLTSAADLAWEEGDNTTVKNDTSVYYVIPYSYNNAAEYIDYAAAYVIPQYRGWLEEGLLKGYELLLNRHPVGKPWDALVILRYSDIEAFGKRQHVLEKVREGLRQKPKWVSYHARKGDIRSETENSIASLLSN
ncbi:hypothetical protein [Kordiimonas pumila]|uniref:NIPSNAP domain-containing protein n=1 Tax=Kordiimonas pumila TaxID=2161677 RepID=A0ABV7D8G9_9PROT|nr:hypothetical protein [Kordiimonas pumila]